MSKLFSLVVPTCNRPSILQKCLLSIINAQDFDRLVSDVIITDDSTSNETRELLTEAFNGYNILYINGPRKGPAANRNNGAKLAKATWLIFLDDDIIIDSLLFVAYEEAIKSNDKIEAFEGAIHPSNWELLKSDGIVECPINVTGGLFWSANICIDRHLFNRIKGFDERFKKAANEDQDIYLRIIETGNIVFVDRAIVVHDVRRVSLFKKVLSIPSDIESWLQLMLNKKHSLLYIYRDAIYTQFISGLKHLFNMRLSRFFYHMANFTVCVVLIPFQYFTIYRK